MLTSEGGSLTYASHRPHRSLGNLLLRCLRAADGAIVETKVEGAAAVDRARRVYVVDHRVKRLALA